MEEGHSTKEASMTVRRRTPPLQLAALALALALPPAAVVVVRPARADAPPAWKNLQILPKTMPRDQLKALMKAQSKALGVECDHCHEMPDADKDTKNKEIARQMMRMTSEINGRFLKGMDDKVTCNTCHRGKEKPEKG
jgi:hypothetical protein